jgi:hypothetical protein
MTLIALVLSPSILPTHAVGPSYLPAATPGQFAQYKVLKDSCQSLIPQICKSLGTSLNETTYAAVQVVSISGPAVTLELISIFKNGTSAHEGALVNVATGASNVTAFSLAANDYFLLSGGLEYPNQLWNTPSAPSINKTINEMILGSSRNVNFLNYSMPGSYLGLAYSEHFGFAFDQSSGFLIQINFSLRTIIPGTVTLDVTIAMVDNNVWGNARTPDFDLTSTPTNVNIVGDNSGNSTVTLHRLYGYSGTVILSAKASASGISCSFSANSLPMGGPDRSTLTCRGSPGTYTIKVEGNGGYSMHDTSINVTVIAAPKPPQPASNLSVSLVYGGLGVAAVVAAVLSFLFLRKRHRGARLAPGETSLPASEV